MKKIWYFALAGLLIASVASANDSKKNHPKGKKDASVERVNNGSNVAVKVVFLPREVRIIQGYYGTRFQGLPPGLQKKYRRTGQLPPGWQKKMEPFPVALDRRLEVLPVGYSRGVIDGHAIIYNPRTHVIFDIAVLF